MPSTSKPQAAHSLELSQPVIDASQPFVGRWNTLVSTTNWEKGRIIADWRQGLEAQGAAATECSDEAWARLVGDVTSQHVGRLRRVHERFAELHDQYDGLYWSHFLAALDWQDAEMWLEGALQQGWSVAKMRAARWEAIGGPEELKPSESDIYSGEIDGEAYASLERQIEGAPVSRSGETAATDSEGADRDDSSAERDEHAPSSDRHTDELAEAGPPPVRPFENLAELPDDVSEAFESFKLAIITHKLSGWAEVSRADLLGALDALKALATAPSEA